MSNSPYNRNYSDVQPLPVRQPARSRLLPWLIRLPLLGITALLLLAFIVAFYLALHQLQYAKTIFPGVSAYGVDLSGMTQPQAMQALAARYTYGENAIFTFRYASQSWQKSAHDLGVVFDPAQTVDQAFSVGRSSTFIANLADQSQAWVKGYPIEPIIVFDQSKATAVLNEIGATINHPVHDATIVIQGTKVTTTPGEMGHQLDIGATLGVVREKVLNMNTGAEIPLIVKDSKPGIADVGDVATNMQAALSGPIKLHINKPAATDPGPWQVTPDFIGAMLSVVRKEDANGKAHYEIVTNLDPLKKNLFDGLTSQLTVSPVNARFLFNEDTKQLELIKDSVDGRTLDTQATLTAVQNVLFQTGERNVALVFKPMVAPVNSKSTAQQLGITEKIVESTTFFYGSTMARRTNIQVAASQYHGLVIAPGEEFSFDNYLGDVSPETGYETGLVIVGDKTIAGVGGGVCQVSSTVFQAAFFAGFPIKERYAHGYRVGYYESGTAIVNGQKVSSGAGLDATVFSPEVDLKFINDTPYYLLMEEIYTPNAQSLTFKFFSTSTGRIVTKSGPTFSNTIPHGKPKYTEDPTVRPGDQRQVDYAVDGIDAHVYRTITQNGQVIVKDEDFYSHYLPWSAQFLVAPGYAPKG